MDVDVIIGGNIYSLSDGALCYFAGQDGLGMSALHRLVERGPNQHGETDRGFRLDPRVFRLYFDVLGDDPGDVYDKRDTVLRYFAPRNSPTLRFRLKNGETRSIDAHAIGDLTFPSSNRMGYVERAVVTLNAPDPTLYDPTLVGENFTIAATGAWAIPWVIPWPIGAAAMDTTQDIAYTGSFSSYPVIYALGPITDLRIENVTTGDALDFTGTTIAAGDSYTIDCRYGYKTVVDNAGDNKIADLTDDDDLATFHLVEPVDGSASRTNKIRVTGTGVTAITNILLTYYTRFIGI